MPPQRKPLLDLESELQGEGDDSDDDDDMNFGRPKPKRVRAQDTRREVPEIPLPAAENSKPSGDAKQQAKPKKEKEFAWMDSDAEDSDAESEGNATYSTKRKTADDPAGNLHASGTHSSSSKKARSRSRSRSSSEGGPPLPASVAEVETFSQMVRMVEGLTKRVPTMDTTELVQCIAAAARVKFFDGDFLQEGLVPQIRTHLSSSRRAKSPFTTEELVTMLCSLAELNCFDKSLFANTVRELADKRYMELQGLDKCRLLAAFKAVKYECNDEKQFFEWLKDCVKNERYEMLSAEQRMIVGNSKNGMHAPEGYLRSFVIATSGGGGVNRPHGLSA